MVNRLRRGPRRRRSRPNIDWVSFKGTGTAVGTNIIDVTVQAELANTARPIHIRELQVQGIVHDNTSRSIWQCLFFKSMTSSVVGDTDVGVRTRMMVANTAGIPFFHTFKNMVIGPGQLAKLQILPYEEDDATATHEIVGAYKIVFKEVGV